MKFFSLDSPFMRAMSRLADLMLLNVLLIFTCIPIFTVGAAFTAMYTVCFRLGTEDEGSVFKDYFRAFRDNFKQATCLWLVLLLIMGTAFFDAAFFYTLGGIFHAFWILFAGLLILALIIFTYVFPLLSQFENTCRHTFKNAFLLGIGYLPKSLLMAALLAVPVVLAMVEPYIFFLVGFIWIVLYFSAVCYLNSKLLKKIFQPFYEQDSREEIAETEEIGEEIQ